MVRRHVCDILPRPPRGLDKRVYREISSSKEAQLTSDLKCSLAQSICSVRKAYSGLLMLMISIVPGLFTVRIVFILPILKAEAVYH